MRHYVGFSQIGSHMHSIKYTHRIAYMDICHMYGTYICRTDTCGRVGR